MKRNDGNLIKNMDGIHTALLNMSPRRTECEAFINFVCDLSKVDSYLKKKKKEFK